MALNRLHKSGIAAAMVVSLVGSAEGLRQSAYPDPATRGEPWTICYGHTGHVTPGERKSLAECKSLLLADLDRFDNAIEKCIHVPMTDGQEVAFLSLAYNIGSGGFCHSSIARDMNSGYTEQACNDLLKFNRAAGIVFPGLTRRREKERALCLE